MHKSAQPRERAREREIGGKGDTPAAFVLLAAIGSPPACVQNATSSER